MYFKCNNIHLLLFCMDLQVIEAEYAVRGEIVIRAQVLLCNYILCILDVTMHVAEYSVACGARVLYPHSVLEVKLEK